MGSSTRIYISDQMSTYLVPCLVYFLYACFSKLYAKTIPWSTSFSLRSAEVGFASFNGTSEVLHLQETLITLN